MNTKKLQQETPESAEFFNRLIKNPRGGSAANPSE